MNPLRFLTPVFFALAFLIAPASVQAGLCRHCEHVEDYQPNKGVLKLWTWPIKTEWEQRYHCLPCGRKIPYKVKVITYRERYTDGTQRTWKCVVAGSEVTLGK